MQIFDSHLWYRFWTIAAPYWRHEEKWKAWALLLLVVGLLFAQAYFAVLVNEQTGEFTSALAARQVRQRFAAAFENYLRLIRKQLHLNLFQYAYTSLTIILPSAIVTHHAVLRPLHRQLLELIGEGEGEGEGEWRMANGGCGRRMTGAKYRPASAEY